MGAYENPQAVIDTGTPQILANAIGNLGKQAAGVLDQEKEKYPIKNKPGEFYEFRMDMSTRMDYIEKDYLEALDFIGIFN